MVDKLESITLRDCTLTSSSDFIGFNLIMACEDYFRLGDRMVHPIINIRADSVVVMDVRTVEVNSPLWVSVLKVISYCTVIIPLIVGVIVLVARTCYTCLNTLPGDVNKVFQEIHIGNGHSFLGCTELRDVDFVDGCRRLGRRSNHNPLQFQHVISMCPISHVAQESETVLGYRGDHKPLAQSFQNRGIEWFYAGRSISDLSESRMQAETEDTRRKKWAVLVHDTTFPESELSQFEPYGKNPLENIAAKERCINELDDPIKWFEPAFKILDKAVHQGEKVLVHCAMGQSRSAVLVAAYLINRFYMTADGAEALIKQSRPCVAIKFMPELRQYEQQLRQRKAAQSL